VIKKILGFLLVLGAISVVVMTFFPIAQNEVIYQLHQTKPPETKEILPLSTDFGIIIPKLGINAKVIANVDPFNAQVYQKALTQGVAHAQGSALPDEEGNVFIFSHSSEDFFLATRYNSIFYLLTKLEMGDEVILYYHGQKYTYQTVKKEIVDPQNLSSLANSKQGKTLTLMTCYPPGTDIKRLVITATGLL